MPPSLRIQPRSRIMASHWPGAAAKTGLSLEGTNLTSSAGNLTPRAGARGGRGPRGAAATGGTAPAARSCRSNDPRRACHVVRKGPAGLQGVALKTPEAEWALLKQLENEPGQLLVGMGERQQGHS